MLNPALHLALINVFGRVKVSHPGESMSATYVPDNNNKAHLSLSSYGETYIVCCPFCHDTSGHLSINHRWGQFDPQTRTRNLWLVKCFRDDCLRTWENRKDLADRVLRNRGQAALSPIPVAAPEPLRLHQTHMPHDFRLLTDLPPDHPANAYVKCRGFARGELVELWEVGFSASAFDDSRGRLIIPFRAFLSQYDDEPADDGDAGGPCSSGLCPTDWHLVGYQGRVIDKVDEHRPKYLTSDGTPKSLLLYGLHRVPEDVLSPIIVCEGPTDVWRAGPGAVALLGKTISHVQCRLIRGEHPGREVVVMLDPEAADEAAVVAERLRAVLDRDLSGIEPGRVVVVQLSDERDPAECTREEIWDAARGAISQRNAGRGRNRKK